MNNSLAEFVKLMVPGLVAVLGNIIFYWIIKSKIDKKIEKHKISYSGIFREKIEIYKSLLQRVFDLKQKIQQYQYFGIEKLGGEIRTDFNNFISFYLVNQPFLSEKMITNIQTVIHELQGCFDDFFMHNSLSIKDGISPEQLNKLVNKFFESGNKFKTNHPFKDLENTIIAEMRIDLKIDQ